MKKILATILCVAMALSLVACASAASDTGKDKAAAQKLKLRDGEKLYTDGIGYLTYSEDESGYCTIRVYTEDYEHNGTYNGQRGSEIIRERFTVLFSGGDLGYSTVEYTHSRVGDSSYMLGNDPLIGYDVSDEQVSFVYADQKKCDKGYYYDIHRKTYTRVSTFEN